MVTSASTPPYFSGAMDSDSPASSHENHDPRPIKEDGVTRSPCIKKNRRRKSSRACDLCRNRKIRCDIEPDASVCTSCQRLGAVCTFSRIQLKRGPTKRRLSDASIYMGSGPSNPLPSIESLFPLPFQTNGSGPIRSQSHPRAQSFSHTPYLGPTQQTESVSRAQSFSHPYAARQPSPQNGEYIPPYSMRVATANHPPGYTEAPTPPHIGTNYNVPLAHKSANSDNGQLELEFDRNALSNYYKHWHDVLPILPDTREELFDLLREAPVFGQWLVAAVNSSLQSVSVLPPSTCAERTVQVMALLLTYLQSMDPTWLAAALPNAIKLSQEHSVHGARLLHILCALDFLHAIVFQVNRLTQPLGESASNFFCFGENGVCRILPGDPMAKALNALKHDGPNSRAELKQLQPFLVGTPLAGYVSAVLQRC